MNEGQGPHEKSGEGRIVPSLSPFDRAFLLVLGYEGGYGIDTRDSGGETKYGISKAQYPNLDIKNLTIDDAKAIYRSDYWHAFHCGEIPWPLGFAFFDSVVQFAPRNPIRWLQGAVGAVVDGVLGPRTIQVVNECRDIEMALIRFMHERGEYRTLRPNYDHFGKGWRKRDLMVVADAIRFWGK
jgi:lysozyme family protein